MTTESRTEQPQARYWAVDHLDGLDFDPLLTEMLRQERICKIKLPHGEGDAWLVTRHADVEKVTNDPRFSRKAMVGREVTRLAPHFIPLDDAVGFTDPPEHTRLRRSVSKSFTGKRMALFRPRAQAILDPMLDRMERQGPPVDVMEYVNTPFALDAMSLMMGVPEADRPRIAAWAVLIISAHAGRERSEQAKAEIGAYFRELATRRRDEPREDLISDLAAAWARDEMTLDELIGFAVLMQISGTNSVRFNSANMVYLLLTHPDHLARLRTEPDLMPQAVEELLRYIPHRNGVGLARIAVEDVEIGGVTIRAGDAVYVSYLAASRDPAVFPNPDTLDFDRTYNPHLAFGHGPHYCAGPLLARMECQMMLTGLLERFPGLRLAVPEDEIRWRRGELIRGPHALPVAW